MGLSFRKIAGPFLGAAVLTVAPIGDFVSPDINTAHTKDPERQFSVKIAGEVNQAQSFGEEENYQAHDRQCSFGTFGNIERELCYQKIKQAYDADVGFDLFKHDDMKACLQYKDEFDAKYRVTSEN